MTRPRLLFASCHGYVDPSSGASWATRDLLESMAARGLGCRAVSTCVLDRDPETPAGPILQCRGLGYRALRRRQAFSAAVERLTSREPRSGV